MEATNLSGLERARLRISGSRPNTDPRQSPASVSFSFKPFPTPFPIAPISLLPPMECASSIHLLGKAHVERNPCRYKSFEDRGLQREFLRRAERRRRFGSPWRGPPIPKRCRASLATALHISGQQTFRWQWRDALFPIKGQKKTLA